MQVVVLILIATLCVAVGETLLSIGMKQAQAGGRTGLGFVLAAATNRTVVVGTALMAVYFGLYALCLSWADISFVLPFTGLSFLFVAVLAHYVAGEHVSVTRWAGAGLITLGVVVVGIGMREEPALTRAGDPSAAARQVLTRHDRR